MEIKTIDERIEKLKDFADVTENVYLFKELEALQKEIKLEVLKIKLMLK
mgnify:CR=1 FL=1